MCYSLEVCGVQLVMGVEGVGDRGSEGTLRWMSLAIYVCFKSLHVLP